MPTLRRSKSLNDKISRQKNRTGDVIRDPRSPDVEGRTRTCVDNFQALVHLRKQTEDKARQLELAYSYATNGHTYLRRGPSGGVELPYATSITPGTKSSRHPDSSESKLPINRRQHSAEGRTERDRSNAVVRRQESYSEAHKSLHHQSRREQKCPRPMSMVEPRVGGLFPSQDELSRKDQMIQNLTESQKGLNAHNQKLLSKVDELEFENNRLRDILNAHHVQVNTISQTGCSSSRPHRSISLYGDAMRIPSSSVPSSAVVSPRSETSVSGYGSLADSPSGEGFTASSDVKIVPRTVGIGDYDDDTLPLPGVSECSLESKNDTLAKTSSSSSSASRGSRAPTVNLDSDRSGHESNCEEKVDGTVDVLGKGGDRAGCPRIEELAKQVAELSSQRDTVIVRYKQLVEENLRIMKRDKRIQEELGALLEKYGDGLEQVLRSELQIVEEQLKDLSEDVQVQVQTVLCALDSSSTGDGTEESSVEEMNPQVQDMLNKLVDLIGPDCQRLGRRLTVPQQELDKIEKMTQDMSTSKSQDTCTPNTQDNCNQKTQGVLKAWLKRRGGAESDTVPPAAQHLAQALRDVDKDILHCQHPPVSGPERQALRNCLQFALDHVADPRDVLDHLIALNELTPVGICFVQEVIEKRERAVCRLWHVSEYRGTGVVSRLALALDRSHYPQVSHRLRDELEIQNSRIHSQCHQANEEPASVPVSVSTSVPPSYGSRPASAQTRSRPISRVPRFRSKTVDSSPQPAKSPPVTESSVSAVAKGRPPLLRQIPLSRKEREVSMPQKERSMSGIQDKTAPAPNERTTPTSKKEGPQAVQQQERRVLPSPRERPFSPFQKDKSASSSQRERALSPSGKTSGKTDAVSQKERPTPQTQKERPFSPFEKDKAARPFSPFDKDKQSRPFSPFEKDKLDRPFSPFEKDKMVAASHIERATSQTQKERPFSPCHRDKAATSIQKEKVTSAHKDRAVSITQKERAHPAQQKEKQSGAQLKERSILASQKERQAVWDKRSTAGSSSSAATSAGARNSVVLEQGGKISRV